MKLGKLKPTPNSTKNRKRVGRGPGSGKGKRSGRGDKGYHSRSGSKRRAWYEGGQMPLQRRIPKRGFSNSRFRTTYQIVNLSQMANLDTEKVDIDTLYKSGLINSTSKPVKVLGSGELSSVVSVTAHAFSKSAVEKIEKAGGKVTVL
ncbi:MAG: 50S ribosomal protein L15 [Candidatus Marinimicrobia bacterium]|nr:50S ribosomal protein L15 [Candidatus Neomarinimicrobiota bacterium]MBL7046371.1 50S ribosomal protein L15 [Candidatus Neomarinimicrobiota bacterium]